MRIVAALSGIGCLLAAACAPAGGGGGSGGSGGGQVRAPSPAADWSQDLARLLPGIEACLDRVEGAELAVTKAWPLINGLTGVRLQRGGGGGGSGGEGSDRVDCIARADGRGVILTEPVLASSHLVGERQPVFTPGTAARPAGGTCMESAAARDGAGKEVGWLSYSTCPASASMSRAAAPGASPPPASDPALPGDPDEG